MEIWLGLGIAALLGLIPASIAKNKGYSFGLWWFYGWLLFIVAIIHVNFIEDKTKINSAQGIAQQSFMQPDPVPTVPVQRAVQPVIRASAASPAGERFTELYRLPSSYYLEGCPVLVDAGALLKDNQAGNILSQIRLKNISEKTIVACKIAIKAFELNGTELQGVEKFSYLDLDAAPGDYFGTKIPVYMPDPVTRRLSVSVIEVISDDETIWSADTCDWAPVPLQKTIAEYLGDPSLAEQFRLDVGENSGFVPVVENGLFLCTCGAANLAENAVCCSCGRMKTFLLESLNADQLSRNLSARLEKEAAQKEMERLEAERIAREEAERAEVAAQVKAEKSRKAKKVAAIIIPIAVIIAAVIALWPGTIRPAYDRFMAYRTAVKYLEDGSYDAAIDGFKKLGDYKDSKEKILESNYRKADSFESNGDYEAALLWFSEISSYADAQDRISVIKETVYSKASDALKSKKFEEALNYYTLLSKYKYSDANDKILATHYAWGKDLYTSGNYKQATKEFGSARNYSDAPNLYKAAAYYCGCELADAKQYEEAISYFKKCGDYEDAVSRLNAANYYHGCDLLSSKQYAKAITAFNQSAGYKDAGTKILDAKFGYVQGHKSRTDGTTYQYLKDLTSARYSGAQGIYNELYAWKAVFLGVNYSENEGNYKTSVSKYNTWYAHFKITGGPPYGEASFSFRTSWPDGSSLSKKFGYKTFDGDKPWVNGWYETPAYGATGTVTVTIYVEGASAGSASFKLTN